MNTWSQRMPVQNPVGASWRGQCVTARVTVRDKYTGRRVLIFGALLLFQATAQGLQGLHGLGLQQETAGLTLERETLGGGCQGIVLVARPYTDDPRSLWRRCHGSGVRYTSRLRRRGLGWVQVEAHLPVGKPKNNRFRGRGRSRSRGRGRGRGRNGWQFRDSGLGLRLARNRDYSKGVRHGALELDHSVGKLITNSEPALT